MFDLRFFFVVFIFTINILVQNRKVLENHFYSMKNSFEAGDYEWVANKAYEFAADASWSSAYRG